MQLPVLTYQGNDTGRKATLPSTIFSLTPNNHVIYLDIKCLRANQRQGTHKTKERCEVQGSTRKAYRQKGTGNARRGDMKTNILRGGGRTFGPRPRHYSLKLNKKQRILARKSALSYKAQNKQIHIIEDFSFEKAKTKNYVSMLKTLSMQDKKTLLVLPKSDKNILLAARNLQKAQVITAHQINTYDVLNANHLLLSESTLALIEKNLSQPCKS